MNYEVNKIQDKKDSLFLSILKEKYKGEKYQNYLVETISGLRR